MNRCIFGSKAESEQTIIHSRSCTSVYLIGLDLGTSAIKGVLMSSEGAVVSREKVETRYQRGEGGSVQFDADDFYMLVVSVIRKLADALPKSASVAGLSMASASGNTMLADNSGKPLLPAISWMDTRVTDEIERVFGKMEESEVHELTGWPLINNMFPLAHLSWLKCHKPEMLQCASRVCMTTDYVNYRLTGCWGIDTSTATTFYLQNQVESKWHFPYLEALGIPETKLPPVSPSGTLVGRLTQKAAAQVGLPAETPVVLGAFDHPCAARGSGVLEEGQLLISCGTSWVGFYPVKDRQLAINQKMLVDTFLNRHGLWGAMFSLPAIARKVDQYICRYISDAPDRYCEFDRLSSSSQPGAGGLVINPVFEKIDNIDNIENLENENQTSNPENYSKADIARAIMEGTAYLLKKKIDCLRDAGFAATSVTMVGGPSETFPWPQIVCDVLGMELSTINGSCAGAAGAAILAGTGTGIYIDERDAFRKASFDKTSRCPDKAVHETYKKLYSEFQRFYYI